MKFIIPWMLVGALLAGGGYLFMTGRQKDADIERLKAGEQELTALRTENQELKKRPDFTEEVARLRKDNEDLLRLRNEVKQLRDQAKTLGTQLQTAQTQRDQIQAAAQAQQEQAQQAAAQADAARAQQAQKANSLAQFQQCASNLRLIESAKAQWAADPKKTGGPTPTIADLAPYLGNRFPVCPAGGAYQINLPGHTATCSIPGHKLE